ncbi:beta-lactamase transpeptidase-like protein [Coniophora puteana RWD-64-598 SS2]|uniref:Beta-lactamase transpeptidase-like protein n=1 Tax=Coniophora puteana (strain RWD-64-598) TaxID=741705 RepID=A0A5M3MXG1_CONPW|nr:beta-lactamase transpeptidase-like protein [Coniophora puteana RWD-64-598 SS2]EIW83776.1 beta-lactamase transpeptidase-like protein [Coniophora puteana RWD-64-598 SS2]
MTAFSALVGLLAIPVSYLSSLGLQGRIPQDILSSFERGPASLIDLAVQVDVQRIASELNISGVSTGVVRKDGQVNYHPWGKRTEDDDEVASDTLFHMASVSKAFCASALGVLIDDYTQSRNVTPLPVGLSSLSWETKVKDVLPADSVDKSYGLMDEWAHEKATLRDILGHVSGVPRHDLSYGSGDTAQSASARLRHLRPAYELREKWSYNNQMFTLAAHIIATHSGQTFQEFVRTRIFGPLGMSNTTYSPQEAYVTGRFAQGFTREQRRLPEWFSENVADLMAGAGGVISSAEDMTKWAQLWLNEGVWDNETIIPKDTFEKASTAYSISVGAPAAPPYSISGYGMGWWRHSYRGHDVVYHSGSIPGFSTLVSWLPSDGLGVVVFANTADVAGPVLAISNRLVEGALGLQPLPKGEYDPYMIPYATSSPGRAKPPPSDSDPTPELEDFAGTYHDPGYGSLSLCAASTQSAYCTETRATLASVDAAAGRNITKTAEHQLVGAWPRVWCSHVRLVHRGYDEETQTVRFGLDCTSLYPQGYGKNTTAFELSDFKGGEVAAEFVLDDGDVKGFGVFGLLGPDSLEQVPASEVKERAEVWFEKV